MLFGTRNLDANERHHGVVADIAVEAVVKLFALVLPFAFFLFGEREIFPSFWEFAVRLFMSFMTTIVTFHFVRMLATFTFLAAVLAAVLSAFLAASI